VVDIISVPFQRAAARTTVSFPLAMLRHDMTAAEPAGSGLGDGLVHLGIGLQHADRSRKSLATLLKFGGECGAVRVMFCNPISNNRLRKIRVETLFVGRGSFWPFLQDFRCWFM
jgi:hypothetical protein